MENLRIVLIIAAVTFVVTSTVIVEGRTNVDNLDRLEPVQVVLETENTKITGILDEYCEKVEDDTMCVNRFISENPTANIVYEEFSRPVKPTFETGEEVWFRPLIEKEPEKVNYTVKDRATGEKVVEGVQENQPLVLEEQGKYRASAEVGWNGRSVIYTYLFDIKE